MCKYVLITHHDDYKFKLYFKKKVHQHHINIHEMLLFVSNRMECLCLFAQSIGLYDSFWSPLISHQILGCVL